MENRKEAVKLAAVLVVIMLAVLLYLHQGSAELAVTEADGGSGVSSTSQEADETAGDGSAGDAGLDADAKAGLPLDTDGIVYVDIGGAVKNPQLAELSAGSVQDLNRFGKRYTLHAVLPSIRTCRNSPAS